MKTIILKINKNKPEISKLRRAAEVLKAGGVVVFPTDTVYGLAANAFDKNAQNRIYKLKGRPFKKPLVLMANDSKSISLFCELPSRAFKLAKKFWPGPLTLILETTGLGKIASGGRRDLGVRIPDSKVAHELIKLCGFPLVTTSANPSSRPSAKSAKEAKEYFDGKVELVIDSGVSGTGKESTVIDASHFHCIVVREGCLPSRELLKYLV